MTVIPKIDIAQIREQNISYYDAIAEIYDYTLNQKESDKLAREKVKEKLVSLVQSGWVLDFGGGTGLDLDWLSSQGYKIIFCEPSVAMREKAMLYNDHVLKYPELAFLNSPATDWTQWSKTVPFPQKMAAILANFGVLNCIPDIQLLFSQLANVIQPGGHLITLVLDRSIGKLFKWHRRNALQSLIFRKPFVMYVWHQEHRQTVYVHSIQEIRKAAAPFFECHSHESLTGTGFHLIHLVKK